MRRTWFWVLMVTGGVLAFCGVGEAALSVEPTRAVHQVKRGRVQRGVFHVTNTGAQPVAVTVEPEDWSQGLSAQREPAPWITVNPGALNLEPGQSADVHYTVRVPRRASGELRTQVFFTTEQASEGLSLRSRLGAIIYVAVKGTEQVGAEIRGVTAHYTPSHAGAPKPDQLDVAIRVRNRGNTHAIPAGHVILRDADGQVAAKVDIRSGWGLLPREEDVYHAIGHDVHLKPGEYTAEVTVMVGQDLGSPVTATKTFQARVTHGGHLQLLDALPPSP